MSTSSHYDLIVIDTGPDSSLLAYKFAPLEKKSLLLQRGGNPPCLKDT